MRHTTVDAQPNHLAPARRRRTGYLASIGLILTLLLLAGCTLQVMPEDAADTTQDTAATPVAAEETTAEPEEEATPTSMAMEEATPSPTPEEEMTAEPEEEATGTPMAEEEATAEPEEEATPEADEEATAEPEEEATATPVAEEEAAGDATGAGTIFAYVGTYTRGAPGGWSDAAEASPPEGVAVFSVDPATGDMTHVQTVPSDNPSWVALHPSQDYLYVSNEIADYEGEEAGSLEAYSIDDATGELTLLNRIAIDSIPAQINVDPSGSYIAIANYVGGSFQLVSINDDGSLGEVTSTVEQSGSGPHDRQEAPHPHAAVFDPSGQYIATADLGTDEVQIFQIADGQLELVDGTTVAPGSGPRHVAFAPSGDYLYVINELSSDISVFPFDSATGELGEEAQTISTVSDDFPDEKSTAEIMVHPSGRFLYGSNRKHTDHPLADAIVAYSIDQAAGILTLIGHTTDNIQFPRAFTFDPSGEWLYAMNQKGDTIIQYAIDQETGELTPTGIVIDSPVPVSMVFKTE